MQRILGPCFGNVDNVPSVAYSQQHPYEVTVNRIDHHDEE